MSTRNELNPGKALVAALFWASAIATLAALLLAPVTIGATLTPWPESLKSQNFHVGETGYGSISREESRVTFRFRGVMSPADREIFESKSEDEAYRRAIREIFDDKSYHVFRTLLLIWPVFIIMFEVWIWWRRHKLGDRKGITNHLEAGHDIRLIGVFFVVSTLSSLMLIYFGAFLIRGSDPGIVHSFWRADVDFFLIGAFILTVTASIYAVYAKLVADKVFDATKEIQAAVTGFIGSFSDVMDSKLENSAPNIIKRAKRSLILYLGNPVAGYFRDEAAGRRFQHAIMETIDDEKRSKRFKVQLVCWGNEQETGYLQENPDKVEGYNELRGPLLKQIRSVPGGEIYRLPPQADPPFRFIVADGRQAILWVLENPTPEAAAHEGSTGYPKAGGFTTQASNMVRVLEGVFENAIRSCSKEVPPASVSSLRTSRTSAKS